ncbi:NAD(P)-dependent dehydrogenase (short-subunit alcohol dehydrogenase family) [Stackebrandtia albiflava]|uniref:NAD(P)-dependent dehydrogenase (Short-subunit alcohol dehydrogenase family) n=1 Tax=Stackebrandtia albiflava TaxID=406432 RepID=A0A562VEA2_9ACTN|nr:SDR family NAD(P)-dependent oxidoreductase [Stackebrandtia albiflava]TWJ16174.1 NAD(P)-dependent dehydrogenase (short-subunit alcohol dehydrogenase family) [Stackebrandtia albiflava]
MELTGLRVVVTSAGRDFGRSLAIDLADAGAAVHLSARDPAAADETAALIRRRGGQAWPYRCDLADPDSIREFTAQVAARTPYVDVLVNNGARYLAGADPVSGTDRDVIDTIAATATGTILVTRGLLPSLERSERPDIVTMVSAVADPGHRRSEAHPAYYAAKHAQAGFLEILSHRLRPKGIRVMSLYPPDFDNPDRLGPDWDAPTSATDPLRAPSLTACVKFAIGQPRDCFLTSLRFEQAV